MVTQAERLGLMKKVIVPSVLNSSVRVWGTGGEGGTSHEATQYPVVRALIVQHLARQCDDVGELHVGREGAREALGDY